MEQREIEIRSEEVQEVMGKVPAWIVRWGITLLFVVILALVIGSCFFRYPDVIQTEMVLTGQRPVAQVVARASGKISSLRVKDGQLVGVGDLLAVIENPAVTEDVFSLKEVIDRQAVFPLDSIDLSVSLPVVPLGSKVVGTEIQNAYINYQNHQHSFRNHRELEYYPKKMEFTRKQIAKYLVYQKNMQRQQQVMEQQHGIAGQQYARDSLLYERGVLSASEFETARNSFLQSRYNLEGTHATLENLHIQIGQMEETLLDLELQYREKESQLRQDYLTAVQQLTNAIQSWELMYCLRAPIAGEVTFTTYWNENQVVQTGENVFTVVPQEKEQLIGKALLPVGRSGKVRTGQRVIVRFLNYPDQEFGVVNGEVAAISLVPAEGNYMVEVIFPQGLTTNYGVALPPAYEMTATAEIVTEELRLIERFIQPIRKAVSNR